MHLWRRILLRCSMEKYIEKLATLEDEQVLGGM